MKPYNASYVSRHSEIISQCHPISVLSWHVDIDNQSRIVFFLVAIGTDSPVVLGDPW